MSARTPEETHALLAAAFNAGDPDAFVQVYEEGAALIVPPDGQRVNGRDEIRRALEPTFALRPRAEIRVAQVLQSDGLALTRAEWTLVGTGAADEVVKLEGRGTIVSRRQEDGSWLIVLDDPIGAE